MLAQLETPTNDFFALARYLVHGREKPPHPDRVAWVLAQNLGTDDPELAAKIMTATAERSRRCRQACLHTIIAWREDERPSPETMQEIAARTLAMAGLGEHQAIAMGHGDRAHPHLHLMINRVHPDTGKAWDMYRSYRLFDRIMREVAEEFGFAYVPCHAFDPEATDELPKRPGSAATYAGKRGAKTKRPQWSARSARTYSARLGERLDAASTWEDLEALFAEEGLAVEAKGKGYVVGDGASYVKLSALGLQRTAKGFARRRSAPRRPKRSKGPGRPLIDAVDMARSLAAFGLVDRGAVRKAVQEAQAAQLARLAKAPLIDQLLADLRKTFAAWTAHTPSRATRRSPPPTVDRKGGKSSKSKAHGR